MIVNTVKIIGVKFNNEMTSSSESKNKYANYLIPILNSIHNIKFSEDKRRLTFTIEDLNDDIANAVLTIMGDSPKWSLIVIYDEKEYFLQNYVITSILPKVMCYNSNETIIQLIFDAADYDTYCFQTDGSYMKKLGGVLHAYTDSGFSIPRIRKNICSTEL